MIEFIGYLSLFIKGITLGLIGAGGSILTIPILTKLFHIPIILSTTYSLFIVAVSALVGSIRYRKLISFKGAAFFAIPSSISVFITRSYIVPNLPNHIGAWNLEDALMALFIIVTVIASYFMIKEPASCTSINFSPLKAFFIAIIVGLLVGLLGVGGGFLTIPALILFLGFSIKEAVPTSLFIIMINASIGFVFSTQKIQNYSELFLFTIITLSGMIVGTYLSHRISSKHLKTTFGWSILGFAVMMAITKWIWV